jgi:hypothetical protein
MKVGVLASIASEAAMVWGVRYAGCRRVHGVWSVEDHTKGDGAGGSKRRRRRRRRRRGDINGEAVWQLLQKKVCPRCLPAGLGAKPQKPFLWPAKSAPFLPWELAGNWEALGLFFIVSPPRGQPPPPSDHLRDQGGRKRK